MRPATNPTALRVQAQLDALGMGHQIGAKVAALAGEVGKADADFVRATTGYAIGGGCPVGLPENVHTYIDQDLTTYAEIWAAGGTPASVFRLTPDDLVRMTGGRVAPLAVSH